MGAIEEVAASEQGGVLVEQRRLQAAQVIGHAIDLLLGVVLSQPDHILRAVDQVRFPLLQVDKAAVLAPAQIDARERVKPHHLAETVAQLEQPPITKLQVVVHERRDGGALVGEATGDHVAACHQDGPMVGVSPGYFGQPLAVDRWLVVFPIGVVKHPGVIGHPGRGVDGLRHAEHHRGPRG